MAKKQYGDPLLAIRVPKGLFADIDRLAERQGLTRSAFVRSLLTEVVEQHEETNTAA